MTYPELWEVTHSLDWPSQPLVMGPEARLSALPSERKCWVLMQGHGLCFCQGAWCSSVRATGLSALLALISAAGFMCSLGNRADDRISSHGHACQCLAPDWHTVGARGLSSVSDKVLLCLNEGYC